MISNKTARFKFVQPSDTQDQRPTTTVQQITTRIKHPPIMVYFNASAAHGQGFFTTRTTVSHPVRYSKVSRTVGNAFVAKNLCLVAGFEFVQ
jgi:hypothetical protein